MIDINTLIGPFPFRYIPHPEAAVLDTHYCARCGDAVTDREREYCLQRMNRFRGLAYCYGCQRAL